MSMNNDNIEEKNLDFKKLFFRSLKYWYFYPIFLTIFTLVGIIIYQTTTPMSRIDAKLLMTDSWDSGAGRMDGMTGALPGFNLGGQSLIENQTIILTSRRQIERTLRQLDFEVSYFQEELFKTQEIYKNAPFRVVIDSSEVKPANYSFQVKFNAPDRFTLTCYNDKSFSKEFSFFEKITHRRFAFTIVPVEDNMSGSGYEENTYSFSINNISSLTRRYQSKVFLEPAKYGSSIIELYIFENNVQKGVDFLNKLLQNSVSYTLERKNKIALNTIQFIESQLIGVADSLGAAENILENFRSRNEVMDVSLQGGMIITQSKELENQRAAINAKLDYYSYLTNYIQNNRDVNEMIAPSSMGADDPILSQLISQLSALSAERSALQFNATSENPNITRINASIDNLKNSIQESLKSVIATTTMTLNDINNRLYGLSQEIKKLPGTEQRLLNIERNRQMNNETYTFLLTKLTEAQIAKASNMPDNEIIEDAISRGLVSPDIKRIYVMVIFFGLAFPTIIIFIKVFFNDKIQEIDDISEITSLPIVGQIPFDKVNGHVLKNGKKVNNNTMLAESFRSIRTSLGYYATQKHTKTILVTSTLPGEGKSFCAVNIAKSYATLGKKTLLMEFDMRRPSLAMQFNTKVNENGLSYFYTKHSDLSEIVTRETGTDNLHVIFSGQVPPNPAELIAGENTRRIIESAQKEYDIIILDTPPLGLVADAHSLTEFTDVNLLVIRHNTTPKPMLKISLKDEKVKLIPHMGVIMNGIPFQNKEYSHRYGYDIKNKYFTSNN
jgi:tyrosine-protein kinase Etk/Wzc